MRIESSSSVNHVWDSEQGLSLSELPHCLDDTHDLPGELTSGGEDKSLGLFQVDIDASEDGQNEGSRLTGAGLRLGDHVLRRISQEEWEGSLLDFRGAFEVHEINSTEKFFRAR